MIVLLETGISIRADIIYLQKLIIKNRNIIYSILNFY